MAEVPNKDEIEATLERVLGSDNFVRARRSREFLRFVVDSALAGRCDINGRAIAVEVFRRSADFDAVSDPLVRVEAGRVRGRLRDYYANAGQHDRVRIDLPRGRYVPSFRYAEASGPAAEARSPRPRYAPALFGLAVAALLAVASLVSLRGMGESERQTSAALPQQKARVLIRPFTSVGEAQDAAIALGLTEEIMSRLSRYRAVEIYVDTGATDTAQTPVVDYVLSGSVRSTESAIRVTSRLIAADSGRQVWTESLDRAYGTDVMWSIVDNVAKRVAANLGEPYGPMFDAEVARIHGAENVGADVYHCGLRFLFALQVMSADAHARATACFERVVATDPSSSVAWGRLASLYRMRYQHDFASHNAEEAEADVDRAYDAALRALQIDYDNAFAHEEVAFVALLRDDHRTFEESIDRALSLNPTSDIRTAIGINFMRMGELERGLALIDQAIADSPRVPPVFFLGYVVDAMRLCDFDAAIGWAERMEASGWPMSQVFLAASAALSGREARARVAVERLLELRPDFSERGREIIARGKFGGEIEAVLTTGLEQAGLALD